MNYCLVLFSLIFSFPFFFLGVHAVGFKVFFFKITMAFLKRLCKSLPKVKHNYYMNLKKRRTFKWLIAPLKIKKTN